MTVGSMAYPNVHQREKILKVEITLWSIDWINEIVFGVKSILSLKALRE